MTQSMKIGSRTAKRIRFKTIKDYQDKSGYHLNAFILDFQDEEIDSIFIDSLKNMKKTSC
ncbi:MAG: hypothetical protein OHK0057_12450 [Thermoflexibacter sp.]